MINCCKGCTRRMINCHSTCTDYITQKEENDRINEMRREHVETKRWTDSFLHNKIGIIKRKKKGINY